MAGSFYEEDARVVEETLTSVIDQRAIIVFDRLSHKLTISTIADWVHLIHIQRRAVNNDVSIKIKGLQGRVKELFELTRLIKVFEIQQ